MNAKPFDSASTSSETVDAEHRVQVGLITALCDAVREQRDAAGITAVLDQLVDYSQAHFLSEELLMRLYGYPEYDDHVQDHGRMTDALKEMRTTHEVGLSKMTLAKAEAVLAFLTGHIHSRDRAFGEFLAGIGRGSGFPGA